MKIGALAERTGLSPDTLRYYEKIGLLPRPARDDGGRREYDVSVLPWISFLEKLKACGMPIRDRLTYARLRAEGDQTGPARRALLEHHREVVRAQVAELTACLDVLDAKIDGYAKQEGSHHDDDRTPTDAAATRP